MRNLEISAGVGGLLVLVGCCVAQAATLAKADKDFVNQAAILNMTGAHEGEMAEKQASRADVKDVAQTLVKDDSEAYGKLSLVANKIRAPIPAGINTGKIVAVRTLTSLKGSRFDRQFAADQVAAEQRAIALFKREARYGQDKDLKAYANEMLPVFDSDLKRAESLAGNHTK